MEGSSRERFLRMLIRSWLSLEFSGSIEQKKTEGGDNKPLRVKLEGSPSSMIVSPDRVSFMPTTAAMSPTPIS